MKMRKKSDLVGASLALLLVLLSLGLAGSAPPKADLEQDTVHNAHFVEAGGAAHRPGVYTFRTSPVMLQDLILRSMDSIPSPGAPDLSEEAPLPSGAKVVFVQGRGGEYAFHIERMNAFSRMTLGLPVSLNHASHEDLTALPGVGPALARAVVEHRERTKGFERSEDLLKVHGIGPETLKRVKPHIHVP